MGPAEVLVTSRYSRPGRLLSLHDPVRSQCRTQNSFPTALFAGWFGFPH